MITNSFTTPATGDSYASIADIDNALIWCDAWTILTDPEKEARIRAASFQADQRAFVGSKANDPQPMAFPRTVDGRPTDDSVFGLERQQRALRSYVATMIEYQLAKVNVGVQNYSIGDESIKHTAMIEPDEARMCLWDWWAP